MCGIAGIISTPDENLRHKNNDLINKSLKILHNRGPNAQGTCQGSHWVFGHTRLAIIDIESGSQPMVDGDSGCALTYNGEIYNYINLRERLKKYGYQFFTNCDTEVVLKAYLHWGLNCFEYFNGFFAIGLVDPRKEVLHLARDRMGIKPLYFTQSKNRMCFASTIPAVALLSETQCSYNLSAMSHYLTTGRTCLGETTLVNDVYTLKPGTYRSINYNSWNVSSKSYWQIPVIPDEEKLNLSFDTAVEQCHALIDDSVKMRLMSDVPLGLFISGGLDSAIISAVVANHYLKKIPTFCAGTDDETLNEYHYAKLVTDKFALEMNSETITSDDFVTNWIALIKNKGLPLSTPNEISIFKLAKALKKRCTVTLTGEGADEIFGGYVQPHFSAFDYDRCSRESDAVDLSDPFSMSMLMKYGRAFFLNDTDHFLSTCSWMGLVDKFKLFKEEVWTELDDDSEMISFYESFFNRLESCSTFDKRLHLHANFNLESLLSRVDSSTMLTSVEARVPFTDHRLVEFAFSLPDHYKMDWRNNEAKQRGQSLTVDQIDEFDLLETKRLTRNAFKNILPDQIIDRKKMSFPVPFSAWFSTSLSDYMRDLCLNSSLSQSLFNSAELEKMLNTGDKNLWLIANLCHWSNEIDELNNTNIHDCNSSLCLVD